LVQLLIWAFASIVLVFIVSVELDMFANRKECAGVKCRGAPFLVSALVKELSTGIGRWMVRANLDSAF